MNQLLNSEAVAALITAGVGEALSLTPVWRRWRWFAELPGGRVAFLAENAVGFERLQREARLLRRLGSAGVAVPAVIAESERHRLLVRRRVPGLTGSPVEHLVFGRTERIEAAARYRVDLPLTAEGQRLAVGLGRALGAIQRVVGADEAARFGFAAEPYDEAVDRIGAVLAQRPELRSLHASLGYLRAWLAALPNDPVLSLRDVQAHNLAVGPDGTLNGLFDFDDVAIGHRLEDFKYMPSFGVRFTELVAQGYVEAGNHPPSLHDVGRFHVLSALDHFAFVAPDAPRWPDIVRWSTSALERFAPEWLGEG